jgi:hypothetical protein
MAFGDSWCDMYHQGTSEFVRWGKGCIEILSHDHKGVHEIAEVIARVPIAKEETCFVSPRKHSGSAAVSHLIR